ncbi:hypothetical protein ABMA28_008887 [Loxostege sticticalis]|uniref:Uncharacterized protein n=1 Tax=Loxostege sticticalis TaxID=481309 RepID=A0ABD0SFX6_LOXSC
MHWYWYNLGNSILPFCTANVVAFAFVHFTTKNVYLKIMTERLRNAVPRIWREPTNHINDCYFCVVDPRKRRAGKNVKKIEYPDTVLLHNGNTFPSLPLAHSVMLKENYKSVKMVLQTLKYEEYAWPVIGDFKMVGFLVGMQGGYTKYPCYLCLWDSRADTLHYKQQSWPERIGFQIGKHNVQNEPIVKADDILMPPLHIKLGLMKEFRFFPKLSEAKIKAGIFVGPPLKKIMASEEFPELLNTHEKQAWLSLKAVIHGFLGNKKDTNYKELVSNMLDNFKVMGCRMSLKVHMLHAHLDQFKNNLGAYSEEQGERFHQDVMDFEQRYQGQYNENMMGDYIWSLIRESSYLHRRKTKIVHF